MDSVHDVLIVGAGFAGLRAAIKFRAAGHTVVVLEKALGVGGTWYHNKYPGARCDVNSLEYSYSFDEELSRSWLWTSRYPKQPEILAYLNHVTEKHDLRQYIRFGVHIEAAKWLDTEKKWVLRDFNGIQCFAKHVVMATGCLSKPKSLEVPGLSEFRGAVYHTAEWPDSVIDFSGKRVAVVGTGSSGIQAVPKIAETCKQLTVFQRTAAFVFPCIDDSLQLSKIEEFARSRKEITKRQLASGTGMLFKKPQCSVLDVSQSERVAIFEKFWRNGDGFGLLSYFTDFMTSKPANDLIANFIKKKIRELVVDPDTAAKLTSMQYSVGTKRLCLDTNGYYECFNQSHVHLVHSDEEPIKRITAEGIMTEKKCHQVDIIVLATGFDAITGSLLAIEIEGRDGRSLRDAWKDGPQTYLGVMSRGFPNMYFITGPQSPSVLTNMVVHIEYHVDWIAALVQNVIDESWNVVEPTEKAQNGWSQFAKQIANLTLFPNAKSWYVGANVPGKPQVVMAFVGGLNTYIQICKEVVDGGYIGFRFTGDQREKCIDKVVRSLD